VRSGIRPHVHRRLDALDLTSADGRAGLGALLAEIERRFPEAILRQAARIELRRLGWPHGRGGRDAPR
jgi:hypothetical protein